ncbi:hypothetical protein GW17_00019724 [Ensete ventricosum]|uniref:Uncharacterized protein n=1 Tax=Ensete ventricosum TaxID=4639 RepID=A0A444F195_ENSVE|nr:hypothetical protein GW17_00019724 [Ensete ventricosum]RZR72547.1 hypothetical protein BHM03_00014500 [Ensete ventricosum]
MGLRPCKGCQMVTVTPLASLLAGGSPPVTMESTSILALGSSMGVEVLRELLSISPTGPPLKGLNHVTPSLGSKEPLEEATNEQPTSSPSILMTSLHGAEPLCAEPYAKESPSSPQPLAGAGQSGDSLDLAQG